MDLKVDLMGTRLDSVSTRLDKTDRAVQDLASRTAALERGGVASNTSTAGDMGGTRSGPSAHPGNPYSRSADYVPKTRRQIIVVGGFPTDTEKAHILQKLRDIVSVQQGFPNWTDPSLVEDMYTPGPFASIGKIKFRSSQNMWTFLKAFKGHKFSYNGRPLFHQIDSTEDERQMSKRTSAARNIVIKHLKEIQRLSENPTREDLQQTLPCDWDAGIVRYRAQDGMISRLFEANRATGLFEVSPQAQASALQIRWAEHLQDINFGMR
eukprot:3338420-Pyramimonas_sp.AAC.2